MTLHIDAATIDYPDSLARFLVADIEGPLLEIGCGTGALTRNLLQHTQGRFVGVDLDADKLFQLRAHLPVVTADAGMLPFGCGVFSAVIFSQSAHLVPIEAAAEARRVLRSTGRIGFCFYRLPELQKIVAPLAMPRQPDHWVHEHLSRLDDFELVRVSTEMAVSAAHGQQLVQSVPPHARDAVRTWTESVRRDRKTIQVEFRAMRGRRVAG